MTTPPDVEKSMDDVLSAVTDLGRTVTNFKSDIDERLRSLEARDAKSFNRPLNGGDRLTSTPEAKEFVDSYLRHGIETKAMSAGSSADGGYTIPKQINDAIESLLLNESPIRRWARVDQANTGDYHVIVNRQGLGVTWAAESDAVSASATPALMDIQPPWGEMRAFPLISQQLLDDSFFNLEAWLAEALAYAFGETESDKFINGNGTLCPKGILNYTTSNAGDATRTAGQLQYIATTAAADFPTVSATVSPFDILRKAIGAMRPGYRRDAAFFMHPTTAENLRMVKDTIGRPLILDAIVAGDADTILGYPLVFCEHMPLVGSNTYPVMFANLKRGYRVVDRIGTRIVRDELTQKPHVGFYTIRRVAGAVVNDQCIKVIKCAAS
jgi:HK97 family phage major capsid protein